MPNDYGHSLSEPPLSTSVRVEENPDTIDAALAGLLAPRKTLPPRLFYDEAGCRLFYRITELPEYYLTRAERAPLDAAGAYIARAMPAGSCLVEYGASDETKALSLLQRTDAAGRAVFGSYVPIDVAGPALAALSGRLAEALPRLAVHPVRADFTGPVTLPADIRRPFASGTKPPALGFFPGSTIGNMEPAEAAAFLRRVHGALGPGARFLLGADLRKDESILVPAYDDAAGVTAAFNLNLLVRLNREAAADFDLDAFTHRAVWNDRESRIEMHLVSTKAQTVHVAGRAIRFLAGETIHTESSYKHTKARIRAIAASGGWRLHRMWTDDGARFGVYLFDRA